MDDIFSLGTVAASDRGTEMSLLNPFTLNPTGAVFDLIGYDSAIVVDAGRDFSREMLRSSERPNIDELDHKRKIVLALASLRGWKNFLFGLDKPLEFSKAKAKEILENPDFFWIVEQIHHHASNRSNFRPATLGK